MLDYRQIYLMNFRSNHKVCKIGISNNASRRRAEVDKAIKGERILVRFAIPIFFAEYHEKRLHEKYGCGTHEIKSIGKGGGGTEWAKLNAISRFCVKVDILIIAIEQYFLICGIFISAIFIFLWSYPGMI